MKFLKVIKNFIIVPPFLFNIGFYRPTGFMHFIYLIDRGVA